MNKTFFLVLILLLTGLIFAQNGKISNEEKLSSNISINQNENIDGDVYFYGDTPSIFTSTGWGWVSGVNSYGDLGKYQRFDVGSETELVSVGLYFFVASVIGSADDITLVVKEVDGVTGAPSTTIHSEVFTTSDITSITGDPTTFSINNVNVPASFFVGIEWEASIDDSIALFTDDDGEGDGAERAWEMWSDGAYFSYLSEDSWGLDVDNFIEVEVETGGGTAIEFSDDFENGTGNWVLEGTWGLSTAQFNSPTNSLTESPTGNYADNLNISATLKSPIDLSSAFGATLKFYTKYNIEEGFDYMYIEVSDDGGLSWIEVDAIDAVQTAWTELTYDIGGFVGTEEFLMRFRFFSDVGFNLDGMYIDDVVIESSNIDESAPLVLHTGPAFYEGTIADFVVSAEITDISGIQAAEVKYTVDGGMEMSVTPSNVAGDTYEFTIPVQEYGAQVDYQIFATDNANNITENPKVNSYIQGEHVFYDDPEVSFVIDFGAAAQSGATGAAVRITVPDNNDILTYVLIRNYTDQNRPNDDMLFHIWENNNGAPGNDIITPFAVTPEATLQNTSPMTRIDLRAYEAELSGLSGDIFIGFTVPTNIVWITQFTPGVAGRSTVFDGNGWIPVDDDYHFRAVFGNDGINNTVQFSTLAGWNIVSVPVLAQDMMFSTIFPTAASDIYGFNQGYVVSEMAEVGQGYWVKFTDVENHEVTGQFYSDNIELNQYWNMVGPFEDEVPVSNITTNPAGIITSDFFGFDNGYTIPNTLMPGKGYWVKASQNGEMIITGTAKSTPVRNSISADWDRVTVKDAAGNSFTLYLASNPEKEYEMPPLPPAGAFDARFSTNSYVENSANGINTVNIAGAVYPLTITLSNNAMIINKGNKSGEGRYIIEDNSVKTFDILTESMPTEYALLQNYPNPFNPTTKIKFALPENANVVVKVFNILGEEVAELINENMEAGTKEVEFNATGLTSGIYFYSISAGEFSEVKKMMLMK